MNDADVEKAIERAAEIGNLKGRLKIAEVVSSAQEGAISRLHAELRETRDRMIAYRTELEILQQTVKKIEELRL